MTEYSNITDIAFLNSHGKGKDKFLRLFNNNLFSDEKKWLDHPKEVQLFDKTG